MLQEVKAKTALTLLIIYDVYINISYITNECL